MKLRKKNNFYVSFLCIVCLLMATLLPAGAVFAEEQNSNLALDKPVQVSGLEVTDGRLAADFAVDGLRTGKSKNGKSDARWSSNKRSTTNPNASQWVYVDLGTPQMIRQIKVLWEKSYSPDYEVQVSKTTKEEDWKTVGHYTDASEANLEKTIYLPQSETARYVRVKANKSRNTPAAGVTQFLNVSIWELEVYEQITFNNAQDVVNYMSEVKPTLSTDGKIIILPESPDPRYDVSLFGSDNKQIIDMNLNYYQPISDMKVNILYKVTNKSDNNDSAVSSNDVSIRIEGKYQQEEGDNPVPNVIPGLREWKGYTGNFELAKGAKLVVDSSAPESLMETARSIQSYFKNMLEKDITVNKGSNPRAGDIFLTIDHANENLGEEGYFLHITDKIIVSAPKSKGILYGGISLTQILYQSNDKDTIPKGMARDYPKYEVRSGMLDVGRMYIPLDYVQEMTEYMAWFKLNEIQLHINDYWGAANYQAFRVESKKYPEINAKDGYYTQEEYIAYQKNMKKYGIDVVTEIDTPYHAESFRAVNPDMMLSKGALDITTPEKQKIVYPFIESLFDEFLGNSPNDDNRVVQSGKFHMGTDEYDKKYSEQMRAYTDHFIHYINNKGYETRLWGSIGKNGFNGTTPVSNQATMNIWAPYWSAVKEMYDLGYDIINTVGGDLYIVPIGNAGYPDYLDIKAKYDTWEVNDFWGNNRQGGKGGATMPFAHPQTKGAEFAVWNDMTSFSGGLSSYDIFNRMKDAVVLVSEKSWYGEKTAGQTSEQFMERVNAVQDRIATSNPARFVESKTDVVLKYDFESMKNNQVKDLSGNEYDAKIKSRPNLVDGYDGKALQLDGHNYIDLPLSGIGYPYTVSFDIKLDEGSLSDATLFSGIDGDFYLNFNQSGKLGYERNEKTSEGSLNKFENYTFSQDYSLKENEWQNVVLVGDKKKTTLFINGEEVSISKQTNKFGGRTNDSSTFVLPLEKIGQGIKGEIDNITVMNKALTSNNLDEILSYDPGQGNFAYQQKVTASSEYDNSQRAANITDGDLLTRWGSQYKNVSADEAVQQWIILELDQSRNINTVKLHWERARAEKYKLLASNDGITFEEVYSYPDLNGPSPGDIDTIHLENVNAKYLKVVMSERKPINGNLYGYSIYEFEVYGKTDLSGAENLLEKAKALLYEPTIGAKADQERTELIAAKDELESYLNTGQELDAFTYHVLVRTLETRMESYQNRIKV
ncbi:discoidin domain-containing protein [Neobacillus niacini]|uniref:discoidin domain-containing protein n=1 Tax=Neobacillus niacini TaxID=86668 RepID=UPI0006935ACF|nr:discoidin domain-containing protein [Neobacillus niacini]